MRNQKSLKQPCFPIFEIPKCRFLYRTFALVVLLSFVEYCTENWIKSRNAETLSCMTSSMLLSDIDECPANEHQCSHLCHNIPGGWACTCFRGYEVDPADSRDCIDVDECARGKDHYVVTTAKQTTVLVLCLKGRVVGDRGCNFYFTSIIGEPKQMKNINHLVFTTK